MKKSTRMDVERWWRDVFDVGDELWSSLTVLHPHGQLGDYEGWYVAWRDAGVHVSAPSTAEADEVASLTNEAVVSLQEVEFWHAFAHQRGLEVVGPGVHRYVDTDPGFADDVHRVEPSTLRTLRDRVSDEDEPRRVAAPEKSLSNVSGVASSTVHHGTSVCWSRQTRAGAASATSWVGRPRPTP